MASIALDEQSLASLKRALMRELADIISSHLTEAMAAALHYKTHASLKPKLKSFQTDPPIELLDDVLFTRRLEGFGYDSSIQFSFDSIECEYLIDTKASGVNKIKYESVRQMAWRNLIVCAVNEAIRQKLISLRVDDNRWVNAKNEGCFYDFILPTGLSARACIRDAQYGELSIHVAVNPKYDHLRSSNAGFHAGDAFATTWLERKTGAWIQTSTKSFRCRQAILSALASISVEPMGYGDRGGIIMWFFAKELKKPLFANFEFLTL